MKKKVLLALTLVMSSVSISSTLASIPSDAIEYHGHSYKLFEMSIEWNEAEDFCKNMGGHLCSISSSDEQKFINSLLSNGRKGCYWIGGYKRNGQWEWSNGEPFVYTNWAPGEPNDTHGIETNIMIFQRQPPNAQSKQGEWNDESSVGRNMPGFFYNLDNFGLICEWDSGINNRPVVPNDTPIQDSQSEKAQHEQIAVNIVRVSGIGTDRNSAIRDASRNAIESVVGVYIDSRTLVRESIVALDEVYTKSQGYVKDITIINEGWSNGNYQVDAQINVNTEPGGELMNKLSMIMMLNDPRISVIVLKDENGNTHDTISEDAMNERLVDLGFSHVVDANIVSNLQDAQLLNNIYNGRTSLSGVGSSYGVDFLVLGKSSVNVNRVTLNSSNKQNVGKADLSVKIIKFDTGDILGTFSTEGKGIDDNNVSAERKALKMASQSAAQRLEEKFKKISSNPNQGTQLTVFASDYNKVDQLASDLRRLNGVQNVYIREHKNGKAIVEIDATMSIHSIVSALKTVTGLQFTVSEVSNSGAHLILN